jgi:hypothetical protein
MSRPLRIQYPDAWYHVMNRGRRREAIFPGPEDCQRFIELLQEGSTMWNVRIAAFCTIPNHYHLLEKGSSLLLTHIIYRGRSGSCHGHYAFNIQTPGTM